MDTFYENVKKLETVSNLQTEMKNTQKSVAKGFDSMISAFFEGFTGMVKWCALGIALICVACVVGCFMMGSGDAEAGTPMGNAVNAGALAVAGKQAPHLAGLAATGMGKGGIPMAAYSTNIPKGVNISMAQKVAKQFGGSAKDLMKLFS